MNAITIRIIRMIVVAGADFAAAAAAPVVARGGTRQDRGGRTGRNDWWRWRRDGRDDGGKGRQRAANGHRRCRCPLLCCEWLWAKVLCHVTIFPTIHKSLTNYLFIGETSFR